MNLVNSVFFLQIHLMREFFIETTIKSMNVQYAYYEKDHNYKFFSFI